MEGPERTAAMSVRPWKEGDQACDASRTHPGSRALKLPTSCCSLCRAPWHTGADTPSHCVSCGGGTALRERPRMQRPLVPMRRMSRTLSVGCARDAGASSHPPDVVVVDAVYATAFFEHLERMCLRRRARCLGVLLVARDLDPAASFAGVLWGENVRAHPACSPCRGMPAMPHRVKSGVALREKKSEGEALHLPLWRRSAMPAMCRAWQATGSPPWGGEAPSNCQTGERRQIDRRGSWTACGLVQRPARPPLWISWPASSGHRGCRRCFMTPASPDSDAWCCCDAGSAAPGHAGPAHAGPVEPDTPARPPSCRPAPSV